MRESLQLEPLTAASFAAFGEVLEARPDSARTINDGLTLRHGPLAHLRLDDAGSGVVHLYCSAAVSLPFRLRRLERHLHASQAFLPLHRRPFPVVVAAASDHPRPSDLRAFLTDGRQGVCLAPGVWHHHQLSIGEPGEYWVVESRANARFTEFHELPGELWLTG